LSRAERIITTVLVILAIAATGVAFRETWAPLLYLDATPTDRQPGLPVTSQFLRPQSGRTQGTDKMPAALPTKADAASPLAPDQAADPSPAGFDVIRIDPEGTSVFAGRGPAGAELTILANGVAVATVRVGEGGQWAIAIEHRFAPGEYRFALALAGKDDRLPLGQRVALRVAGPKAPPVGGGKESSVERTTLPSPITFVYDEANFTDKGRTQAQVFAEFLRQRRITVATLSGHADERGSDFYNINLSQQRLDAVVHYLREAGFSGKLVLLPMGKREPFAGVDRQLLGREEALALDRRVELRNAQ
jgi:outer membrane protein OmpA-like peptidoglycan-associated protein